MCLGQITILWAFLPWPKKRRALILSSHVGELGEFVTLGSELRDLLTKGP